MIKIEMKGFDELARRLQRMARDVEATAGRLNRTMVSTPLTPDENGFIDRQCPNCSFLFKIAAEDPSGHTRLPVLRVQGTRRTMGNASPDRPRHRQRP